MTSPRIPPAWRKRVLYADRAPHRGVPGSQRIAAFGRVEFFHRTVIRRTVLLHDAEAVELALHMERQQVKLAREAAPRVLQAWARRQAALPHSRQM